MKQNVSASCWTSWILIHLFPALAIVKLEVRTYHVSAMPGSRAAYSPRRVTCVNFRIKKISWLLAQFAMPVKGLPYYAANSSGRTLFLLQVHFARGKVIGGRWEQVVSCGNLTLENGKFFIFAVSTFFLSSFSITYWHLWDLSLLLAVWIGILKHSKISPEKASRAGTLPSFNCETCHLPATIS